MADYLKILRLDYLDYSQRRIADSARCSRHTIRKVLEVASKANIHWPLDEDITNAELERILFPDKYQKISTYVEPDYPYIHRELAKPGVTLTLLWEEYCRKCYESGRTPYMSTQFGDKYRKWARITKATMRIQHKPGDAIQVDWAGDTVPVYDSVTGAQSAAYLFVAVLPCSCYVYMELNFIKCGDYYIPDIKLKNPNIRLGKWGRMRKEYLRLANPVLFSDMVLNETLYEHCAEIEETAKKRMEIIVPQLAKAYGVTEQLKAENQIEWVRQMNACVAQAEEAIKGELIYC